MIEAKAKMLLYDLYSILSLVPGAMWIIGRSVADLSETTCWSVGHIDHPKHPYFGLDDAGLKFKGDMPTPSWTSARVLLS